MSLAYGEQGKYSRAVESPQHVEGSAADQGAVCGCDEGSGNYIDWESAKCESNGRDIALGPGACFLDYDNDGKYRRLSS